MKAINTNKISTDLAKEIITYYAALFSVKKNTINNYLDFVEKKSKNDNQSLYYENQTLEFSKNHLPLEKEKKANRRQIKLLNLAIKDCLQEMKEINNTANIDSSYLDFYREYIKKRLELLTRLSEITEKKHSHLSSISQYRPPILSTKIKDSTYIKNNWLLGEKIPPLINDALCYFMLDNSGNYEVGTFDYGVSLNYEEKTKGNLDSSSFGMDFSQEYLDNYQYYPIKTINEYLQGYPLQLLQRTIEDEDYPFAFFAPEKPEEKMSLLSLLEFFFTSKKDEILSDEKSRVNQFFFFLSEIARERENLLKASLEYPYSIYIGGSDATISGSICYRKNENKSELYNENAKGKNTETSPCRGNIELSPLYLVLLKKTYDFLEYLLNPYIICDGKYQFLQPLSGLKTQYTLTVLNEINQKIKKTLKDTPSYNLTWMMQSTEAGHAKRGVRLTGSLFCFFQWGYHYSKFLRIYTEKLEECTGLDIVLVSLIINFLSPPPRVLCADKVFNFLKDHFGLPSQYSYRILYNPHSSSKIKTVLPGAASLLSNSEKIKPMKEKPQPTMNQNNLLYSKKEETVNNNLSSLPDDEIYQTMLQKLSENGYSDLGTLLEKEWEFDLDLIKLDLTDEKEHSDIFKTNQEAYDFLKKWFLENKLIEQSSKTPKIGNF